MSKFYQTDGKGLKYTELYFDSRDVAGADPTSFEFVPNKPLLNIVKFKLLEVTFSKFTADRNEDGDYCHIRTSLQCGIPKASTNVKAPQANSLGKISFPVAVAIAGPAFQSSFQYNQEFFTEIVSGPQNLAKIHIQLVKFDNSAPNFTNIAGTSFVSGTIGLWML